MNPDQDRVDRALVLLDDHLTTANIPVAAHQALFDAASRTLMAGVDRPGWLYHFTGDPAAHHTTIDRLTGILTLGGGSGLHHPPGCLAYVIDLGHWWETAATDTERLADHADALDRHRERRRHTEADAGRHPPTPWRHP